MVFCLQAYLGFDRLARRDQALSAVRARVDSHPIWGENRVSAAPADTTESVEPGTPVISVEVRFTSRASLDDLVARIESFLTGPRTPVPGSWYTIHECPHDEDSSAWHSCSDGLTRRVW